MRHHKGTTKCPKQKTAQAQKTPTTPTTATTATSTGHRTRSGALHPIRGTAPVTWRRTRYVAVHPNRRGALPTDRVPCPNKQVKMWSVYAGVTASHSGEDCFVTVACGLVDMIDLAKAQLTLVTVAYGLVCRG